MKLCGHTMGTPNYDLAGALELFAGFGLQGIEIRLDDNGLLRSADLDDPDALDRADRLACQHGLQYACLTPYYRDFATDDEAEASLAGLQRVSHAAARLRCPLARVLSGVWPAGDRSHEYVWSRTVAGLQRAAQIAGESGITLAVENHIGTLTMTAEDTVRFVEAVASPHLGIIYDPYFVYLAAVTQGQDGREALSAATLLQAPYIRHVHVKDMAPAPDPARDRKTCLLGEGELPWGELIGDLASQGYAGFLSDEYEKHWRPELPDAAIAMKRHAERLRAWIAAAGA
jgi:L-ribulose-5-phosphate 3-epimerase